MDEKGNYVNRSHGSCFYICKLPRTVRHKTLFDLRSITEINYHPPLSIQKFLFSSQSFTNLKEVQWNQTRRAIAIQKGVSTARSGQESNSA